MYIYIYLYIYIYIYPGSESLHPFSVHWSNESNLLAPCFSKDNQDSQQKQY